MMPKKWKDCVQKVKSKALEDGMSDDEANKKAYKVCGHLRKGYKEPKKELQGLKIKTIAEISKDITSSLKVNEDFLIFPATIAMVTTSKNYVTYTKEALEKLVDKYTVQHTGGYEGAPIFLDHDIRSVHNVIGIVTNVSFESDRLKGDLFLEIDNPITKKVERGLIKHVSFHNTVKEVSGGICGKGYGTDCKDHKLGMEYEGKVCTVIPKELGAIEVSLVSFGGIPEATIGETLQGFDELVDDIDSKEIDEGKTQTDRIIEYATKELDNQTNNTFISEENAKLIKKEFEEKDIESKRSIKMTNEDKLVEFQEQIAKLELEVKTLSEENALQKVELDTFKGKEEERLLQEKITLIKKINHDGSADEDSMKQWETFSLGALQHMANIAQKSKPQEVVEESPKPKGMVGDVTGEQVDPVLIGLNKWISKTL